MFADVAAGAGKEGHGRVVPDREAGVGAALQYMCVEDEWVLYTAAMGAKYMVRRDDEFCEVEFLVTAMLLEGARDLKGMLDELEAAGWWRPSATSLSWRVRGAGFGSALCLSGGRSIHSFRCCNKYFLSRRFASWRSKS